MTTSLFLQSCDDPMSAPTDPHDESSRGKSHLGLRPTTKATAPSPCQTYVSV